MECKNSAKQPSHYLIYNIYTIFINRSFNEKLVSLLTLACLGRYDRNARHDILNKLKILQILVYNNNIIGFIKKIIIKGTYLLETSAAVLSYLVHFIKYSLSYINHLNEIYDVHKKMFQINCI